MKNIRRVFLDPRVVNNPIMIVSINGPRKTGKSFFMNICIRYLQKRRIEAFVSNQESISGFQWGSSFESVGLSLFIWSEPFFIESHLKHKVAVLLLDCQGSLSNKNYLNETFAMHAMLQTLSSLQIYNICGQIQENNLQWFAVSSDYANLSKPEVDQNLPNKSSKPYQTLCILVRDWPYPYEFFYGSAGGQQYINRYLSTQNNLPAENIFVRQFLNAQFTNINGFLMPSPKFEKSRNNNFEGTWGELSNEFHEHVLAFMKNMFSPQSLVLKEVSGQIVTAKELLNNIENYFNSITSNDNPMPRSCFDACAKTHHHYVFDQCLDYYNQTMKFRHFHSQSAKILLAFHERMKISTLQKFDDHAKFGLGKYSETFRLKLESQIDEEFIRFYAINPSQPAAITRLLSVIVMAVVLLSIVGVSCKILNVFNIVNLQPYGETFIFISVTILIVYCLVTTKKTYDQLNIQLEMQTILQDEFLN